MKKVSQHAAVSVPEQQACCQHESIMIEGIDRELDIAILEMLVEEGSFRG